MVPVLYAYNILVLVIFRASKVSIVDIYFQDFKNFQYTLPRVTGMHVHLEDERTVIQLPQNRYDEVSGFHDHL